MNLLKGCEIEAIGINYSVETQRHETQQQKHYLFHLFNKKNTKAFPIQQHQTEPATPTASRRRKVLSDVNCKANPWEILAIVGPSGAGKSTLLEILAGKITPDQGSILVNGSPATKKLAHQFRKISGYVTQHDTLFPLLTVEETLLFTARLRLGLPATELRSRVHSLLDELGLAHVAGRRVGGSGCSGGRVRGISGGERRRVSIGVEVVHEPKVLILDEPTSGLDSSSALQIVDMLKSMAETKGRTIVLTIHQPGFRIVKLFSSVLLLAGGTVLEQGTLDQLGFRLRAMALEMPPRVNMVEFAIDSIDKIVQFRQQSLQKVDDCDDDDYVENSEVQLQQQQQHVMILQQQQSQNQRKRKTLQQLFQQSKVAVDEGITIMEMTEKAIETTPTTAGDGVNFPHEYANSRWKETVILSHRFSKIVFRTKELFACRTLQMLISGLILGSIFYHLRDDLVGAMERAGLFAFILTFLLSCTTEALPIFLQEREILMKETSSGSYRVSSYVIANSIVYLPFLLILAALFSVPVYWLVGLNRTFMAFAHFLLLIWLILYTANSVVVCFSALVPNFIVGNSVISGVMGGFFLFSGYFISKDEIPGYWIGMHYVSLFKYPYEGFLINEFVKSSGGNTNGSSHYGCLERVFGACVVTGKDVLKEEGIREEDVRSGRWRNVLFMLGFIVLYRFISYVLLRWRCSHRSLKVSLA